MLSKRDVLTTYFNSRWSVFIHDTLDNYSDCLGSGYVQFVLHHLFNTVIALPVGFSKATLEYPAEYLVFQDKQAAINKHRQDATQFSLSLSDQKILQMRHLSACGVSPKFTLYWCYEELHQEFRCLNYQGTSFGAYTLHVVLIQNSACKISNLWTRIALKTLNLYLKIPEIK